jgi:biopolymer transport protein ExbD/biopolymer transport protein TolR
VAIAADRRVFLNTVQVRPDDLTQRVAEIFENKAEKIIIIKADEDVEYGAVMSTMDALRAAGVEDMGLITEKKVTAGGN